MDNTENRGTMGALVFLGHGIGADLKGKYGDARHISILAQDPTALLLTKEIIELNGLMDEFKGEVKKAVERLKMASKSQVINLDCLLNDPEFKEFFYPWIERYLSMAEAGKTYKEFNRLLRNKQGQDITRNSAYLGKEGKEYGLAELMGEGEAPGDQGE